MFTERTAPEMKMKKLSPSAKDDMIKAVLLLRFRRLDPERNAIRFVSFPKIARTLNLSANEVAYICERAQSGRVHTGRRSDFARVLE